MSFASFAEDGAVVAVRDVTETAVKQLPQRKARTNKVFLVPFSIFIFSKKGEYAILEKVIV